MKIVKVYHKGDFYFFINGQRSEAYSDMDAVRELLGDEVREVWLSSEGDEDQERALSLMDATETYDDFRAILSDYPELVEEAL